MIFSKYHFNNTVKAELKNLWEGQGSYEKANPMDKDWEIGLLDLAKTAAHRLAAIASFFYEEEREFSTNKAISNFD